MSYIHLTIEHRFKIEALYNEGYSARKIATSLGFHHSTISRELNRISNGYSAVSAQKHAKRCSLTKGRPSKLTHSIKVLIESKLKETWSPEQIIGRGITPIRSFKTIYTWLYQGKLSIPISCLRRKGRTCKSTETRGKFKIGKSIHDRPDIINSRQEFGHWEIDTVVSSRGESKGCLATFTERKTRYNMAITIPNRKSESVFYAIQYITSLFPMAAFKSFTSDRGKEFTCYPLIEASGIDVYFADAYSAWQRGSNENANGLIREFYPKKTNFSLVTQAELDSVLMLINSRPRKCLGYKTAVEVFFHEIQCLE